MQNFKQFTHLEMEQIRGGGNFFEDLAHGRISAAFGREGKPFIGRDFTDILSKAAPVAASLFPPAAPVLITVGALAGVSHKIEDSLRTQKEQDLRRPSL